MARTANRPLPAGRLQPIEVAAFGFVCGAVGSRCSCCEVNPTTAVLAFVTLALYVAAYTPLKRHSALSTAVGAIPGALPPVLGWTASGRPSAGRPFRCLRSYSCGSFRIFWPSPGSIGRTTRRPACECCPATLPRQGLTGLSACVYAAVLIPVSLMPGQVALAGGSYRMAAVLLGLGYLAAAVRFFVQ